MKVILMGLRLEKKGDLYRFWSTILDEYVADWVSRCEALRFLHDRAMLDLKRDTIRRVFCFPASFRNKQGMVYVNSDGWRKWCEWREELFNKPEDEYEEFIESSYQAVLRGETPEIEE